MCSSPLQFPLGFGTLTDYVVRKRQALFIYSERAVDTHGKR